MKRRVASKSENGEDSTRLLTRDEKEQRIRNIVLGQLSRSMKSRYQLEQVLIRKECEPELFEPILDRYEEVELINDGSFARAFVASRRQSRGLSASALRRELKTRGIPDQIIAEALSEITTEDEVSRATELATKKLRAMTSLEAQVASRRTFGFLQRRGYSASVAASAIRRANGQAVN